MTPLPLYASGELFMMREFFVHLTDGRQLAPNTVRGYLFALTGRVVG